MTQVSLTNAATRSAEREADYRRLHMGNMDLKLLSIERGTPGHTQGSIAPCGLPSRTTYLFVRESRLITTSAANQF